METAKEIEIHGTKFIDDCNSDKKVVIGWMIHEESERMRVSGIPVARLYIKTHEEFLSVAKFFKGKSKCEVEDVIHSSNIMGKNLRRINSFRSNRGRWVAFFIYKGYALLKGEESRCADFIKLWHAGEEVEQAQKAE